MTEIVLSTLPHTLSIHKLPASENLGALLASIDPSSIGRTGALFATLHSPDELSIVCDAALSFATKQPNLSTSGPWRAMRVVGELDFALTGILAGLVAPLAAAKISIFAISSFDTDYLLVKSEALTDAVTVLQRAGYAFEQSD